MSNLEPDKMPLSQKIAEFERRIAALEKGQRVNAVSTQTIETPVLEPDIGEVWGAIDRLFKKAFR